MKRALCIGLILLNCFIGFSQTPAVIVNSSNPIIKLDKQTVRHIFLGTKTTWPDGTPVDVVIFRKGPEHLALLKNLIYKTPSKFSLLWKKALFTGITRPPVIVYSKEEMIARVSSMSNAIGYISEDTPLNINIRVLILAP